MNDAVEYFLERLNAGDLRKKADFKGRLLDQKKYSWDQQIKTHSPVNEDDSYDIDLYGTMGGMK